MKRVLKSLQGVHWSEARMVENGTLPQVESDPIKQETISTMVSSDDVTRSVKALGYEALSAIHRVEERKIALNNLEGR